MRWIIILFIIPAQTNLIETPQNITSSPCIDRNHMFLAPGVLTAGGSSRACISRFYPDGPARLVLTLSTDDGSAVSASRDLTAGDGGCLDITVPQKPNTKAVLHVNVRYPEANCAWERLVSVRIASGRVVIVHTERARYRPGDTVRFRAVALKADLTPAHATIDEVWLEGPHGAWEGIKAAQWQRVRTRLGLAQLQHQLDELAPPGKWTVRARLTDGSQGSTSFLVGNYELPPFQLTVRHAPTILRTSERLVWTVCVRYPWSEAVEGMLVIRLRGAGGPGEGAGGIRTAVRLKAPKACHRHAAAAKRIGLNGASPPDVIVADFSFQEEGTRLWQNTTVVSQVVDDPVTLEFLTKHRTVISPGLPYKIKVKATRWDDKPASNERVSVCRSPAQTPVAAVFNATQASCVESVTDAKGIGRVMFTADDGNPYYNFQARLYNATARLLVSCRGAQGRAALGALRADARARTLLPLYLNLGHVGTPLTVHFVVITRGGIIYRWGATSQCPVASTADRVHTADRSAVCSTNSARLERFNHSDPEGRNIPELDSLLERHLSKVMLPVKVSHQMCPDSHLIAYFYHKNELITASKHFEMEECFANKVEATWLARQTLPGSIASLQLSTPGPALCALTVLDTASKWVQPLQSVKDLIMIGLRKLIDGHRNLTEHDAAGDCFLTSDTPDLPTSSIELMTTWLASAGIRLLGGDSPQTRCTSAPATLMAENGNTPRSDFSESWLWRLTAVGTNGSVTVSARAPDSISRFEASALCLAKTGVSASQPAVLQVFREFFIHADNPQRLRRGDAAIVPYRIFNYLYQAISVKIQIVTDSRLSGTTNAETVCIQPRASIAKRLEVTALQSGVARLRIKASTARDQRCTNDTSGKDVSDEVILRIDVEPEGAPVQEHKSAMLCAKDSSSLNLPEVWTWPRVEAVPGTESVTVWGAGNTIAPLRADADALVQLPRGCGEQNMARLATNLLALDSLDPSSMSALTAKDHVARGFTRQLQYAHPGGGFSAFGAADPAASTWLTAFCVRYLRRAYRVLYGESPVPTAIRRAEKWLIAQQMENGCFRNQGHVFHHELKGGLNEDGEVSSVALTAYVITSLIETSPLPFRLVKNSLSCLRALPPTKSKYNPLRVYAHSIIIYALMRLRKYEEDLKRTNEAFLTDGRYIVGAGLKEDEELRELVELLKVAKRTEEYVWWDTGNPATSIEATGYALLALSECPPSLKSNCAADVAGATRWLSMHRNAAGGFISTQDTLVALEGLSRWASILPPINNVTVTIQSGPHRKEMTLNTDGLLPDLAKFPGADPLRITVEGKGCALVQATRFYNALDPGEERHGSLAVQVNAQTDGAFNCDNNTVCFCAATVEVCVAWLGPFPEMALLEIALPGGFGADAAAIYSQLHLNDTLLRRIELSPNSGKATLYLGTRDGSDTISRAGHQCYKVHAVGPRARTKPAYVKVLDYYRPHIKDTQMYNIPEDCPSRIAHDTSNYHASDNLYSKARSLDDSDEIFISHEFSFEDIPEGTPLEDSLYDNLTKRNKSKNTNKSTNGQITNKNTEYKLNNRVKDEHPTSQQNEATSNITLVRDANDNDEAEKDIADNNAVMKERDTKLDIPNRNLEYLNTIPKENATTTNISEDITNTIRNHKSVHKINEVNKNDFTKQLHNSIATKINKTNDIKESPEDTNFDVVKQNKIIDIENVGLKNDISNKNLNTDYTIFKANIEAPNATVVAREANNNYETGSEITEVINHSNTNSKEIITTTRLKGETKHDSNEVIYDPFVTTHRYYKNDFKEELTVRKTDNEKLEIDNPSLTSFHVTDSEKDLDFPTGIEGPIPAIVLPPKNFVVPPDIDLPINSYAAWRGFSTIPYIPQYYQPYHYKQNSYEP